MALRPALVLLVALALAGCGAGDPQSAPPATGTAPAADVAAPGAIQAGDGPEIAGTGLDGAALSVADFRGKPLFVNVWSSW